MACTAAASVFALNRELFKYTLRSAGSGEIKAALLAVPMFKDSLKPDEVGWHT